MKYSPTELIEKDKQYVIHGLGYSPVVLVEAEGLIVRDINGKEYIDGISQMAGVSSVGNSHPKIVKTVKKQVETLASAPCSAVNIPRVELSEKLAKITPSKLNKFFYACGGSEAMETAIKGAIKIKGKKEVIALQKGFHGNSLALLSLGPPYQRKGYPIMPGFRQIAAPYCYRCSYGRGYPNCDFECARFLEDEVRYGTYNEVCAFIVEPMLGNAGNVIPPDKEYFRIIRQICDKYGLLLIMDEVQTGLGRTGKMWAHEHYGVQPDIMAIGKPLGGGLPISATAFSEDILPPDFYKKAWHIFTFSGAPLLCAAASACIDVILEENLPEKSRKMGEFMMAELQEIEEKHPLIGDIRGKGLFIGVELVKDRNTKEEAINETTEVLKRCEKKGLILGQSRMGGIGNVIKIQPPLNIERNTAARIVEILDEAISEVENESV